MIDWHFHLYFWLCFGPLHVCLPCCVDIKPLFLSRWFNLYFCVPYFPGGIVADCECLLGGQSQSEQSGGRDQESPAGEGWGCRKIWRRICPQGKKRIAATADVTDWRTFFLSFFFFFFQHTIIWKERTWRHSENRLTLLLNTSLEEAEEEKFVFLFHMCGLSPERKRVLKITYRSKKIREEKNY